MCNEIAYLFYIRLNYSTIDVIVKQAEYSAKFLACYAICFSEVFMINKAPSFFAEAPSIIVHDELAQFLGTSENGFFKYHYQDVVMQAGHSCPTVASAFLMTRAALKALYQDSVPERGWIKVEWREDKETGVTGVMANVVSLITGACDEGGFKGIANRFNRSHLVDFACDIDSEVRFTRMDNQQSVEVDLNLQAVPMHPRVRELIPLCISQQATAEQLKEFGEAWQSRVKALLLEHADDLEVIQVKAV
jgi:formylmethanofuran dehydrogenase subunit E